MFQVYDEDIAAGYFGLSTRNTAAEFDDYTIKPL